MRPKGKLLALVMIVSAVALAAATGAFTTVEAERTMTVGVSGDDSALLQIEATSGAEEYVDTDGDETVIDIGSDDAPGINVNARTEFGALLNITNQGTNDVGISVELGGEDASLVEPDWYEDGADFDSEENATVAVDLNTGESIQLAIAIDLLGEDFGDDDDLDVSLTIVADADDHSDA